MSVRRKSFASLGAVRLAGGFSFANAGGTLAMLFDGRTLLGTDGTAISSWEDSSGNGRHATQSNASDKPTILNAATPAGTPAASYADSTDKLVAPYSPGLPFTSYHLFKRSSVTNANVWYLGTTGNGLTLDIGGGGSTYRTIYQNIALGATDRVFTNDTDQWVLLTVQQGSGGTSASLVVRANQTAMTVTQAGTIVTPGQAYEVRPGAAGLVAFSAVYAGLHDSTQITAVEDAIQAIFGV